MTKIITHYLLIIALAPVMVIASELKPFASDGCSSFPDGTLQQKTLWKNCCIRHDFEYWKGGTYEERVMADYALERCVAKVGEPEIAKLMLAGVRVGGSPYYPTHYRWGYGWPYLRGYRELNESEKAEVKRQLHALKKQDEQIFKLLTPDFYELAEPDS